MIMKKIHKQFLALGLVAFLFIGFDLCVYQLFTKKCLSDESKSMRAKSIELDKYLPFEEDSEIVKVRSAFRLTEDLPVIDGATALYPVYSAFVNAVYPEDSCQFVNGEFTKESKIQKRNTVGAYKAVVDGTSDIILCAKPSKEQLAYAKEKGVELTQVPIGSEAFVFIVNKDNPVESLTVDEVKGIYTGKYTNWSQLGGENKPIGALQRSEGSGSQTAMLSFMGETPMKKDYDTFMASNIGFSFRYYVEGIVENGKVKMLALDGVYPSKENIVSGSYPIVDHFYAIYRSDNPNPNVERFVNWMLTDEAQKIIEDAGYVGISQ